jgi:hypothetical protein
MNQDIPMMDPAIALEGQDSITREFGTEAAVNESLIFRTCPYFTP